jgi:hypothetical protein
VCALQRDAADVVVPVAGSAAALRATLTRMRGLALGPGDTLTIVDNRGVGVDAPEVLVADELHTSYHARNAGARRGEAPWLVFLDADVAPSTDLLHRLLTPTPEADVGVLAGGIIDEPPADDATAAVRYAARKAALSDATTRAGRGQWAFAQTANAAVRRAAFEQLGGFRADVRSGGDADLCFRAHAAGWRLEARPGATVVHRSRAGVPALLANRFRHGSGAGWLQCQHPGSMPRRHWPGLAWWALRRLGAGLAAARRGDRDAALEGFLDGPAVWAFELGRLVPNRPMPGRRRAGG